MACVCSVCYNTVQFVINSLSKLEHPLKCYCIWVVVAFNNN